MKVSVCLTVFNEESSIGRLLDSLLAQSKKPTEIVVVDGGSDDKTVEILKHYAKKDRRIKFTVEPGSIAHGRNTSIDLAKYPIIAHTDAGCVADKYWLEKITSPFKHKTVGLVAGFYHMFANSPMQEAMNVYRGIPPERFVEQEFLPSARSVAFRKSIWEEIGGYSENLEHAGEDTLFIYEVIKRGHKIVREKEAIVTWLETRNMSFQESIKKFFNYAVGDAQAGIWWHPGQRRATHNLKISSIFARYIVGLGVFLAAKPLALMFFVVYLFWAIWEWRDVVRDWETRAWLPIIQVSSDIAVMAGFIKGLIRRRN